MIARRKSAAKPKRAKRAVTGAAQVPGDAARDVPPALGEPDPAKRKDSVEDPLGDWPETDAAEDEWLVERGRTEDPPDR